MPDRPKLDPTLSGSIFREYYYLKEELTAFCRENGLPVSGGKTELTERIAHFLDTGEVLTASRGSSRRRPDTGAPLTKDSIIEENFVCSEKHRAFFKSEIGSTFT